MLFRIPGLRTRSHKSRYRVPTIHSARAQRLHRIEGGIVNPVERANNMLRLQARKETRRVTPNVNILEICRDRAYERYVRNLLATEVSEVMTEPIPDDEQMTTVDVNRTQILPFSDLYPHEEGN